MPVRVERCDRVLTVIHSRAEARNAVDPEHAQALFEAFMAFDTDATADVAVFWGEGGAFCAGISAISGKRSRHDRRKATRGVSMLSHVRIGVADFERAFAFYAGVMDTLGYPLKFLEPDEPWAGWKPANADRRSSLSGTRTMRNQLRLETARWSRCTLRTARLSTSALR